MCPRELFLQGLREEVLEWKAQGDSIVIMGDWNEDFQSENIIDWKDSVVMHDVILENIGENEVAPKTYQRGRKPIDTIMCTRGCEISKAGYLPLGEGVGDHRALFVDVMIASVLGVNIPLVLKANARRLKLLDPRVVKIYDNI